MPRKSQPKLKEIDLSKTTTHGSAELTAGPRYLALYDGRLRVVEFETVRFGLTTTSMGFHAQYDPPGENFSRWERMWLLELKGVAS